MAPLHLPAAQTHSYAWGGRWNGGLVGHHVRRLRSSQRGCGVCSQPGEIHHRTGWRVAHIRRLCEHTRGICELTVDVTVPLYVWCFGAVFFYQELYIIIIIISILFTTGIIIFINYIFLC